MLNYPKRPCLSTAQLRPTSQFKLLKFACSLHGSGSPAAGPRWDRVKNLAKKVDDPLRDAAATSGAAQSALVEGAYGRLLTALSRLLHKSRLGQMRLIVCPRTCSAGMPA
jgi:hypothetical protein